MTRELCPQDQVQELIGALRGAQLVELDHALSENYEGVLALAQGIAKQRGLKSPPAVFVAALRRGEHNRRTPRAMNDDTDTTTTRRRVPASEALRRLYDAKLGELTRYGVRDPDRTRIAVDYACGEVWRCDIEPMPAGGIVRLEDDLYRAIGFDRVTGARFAPAGGKSA